MNIVYRRGFHEQIADILDTARKPILKTQLIHKVNIEWKRMKFRLYFLQEKGLIEKIGDKYRTTQKGFLFLEAWRKIQNLMRR